MRSKNGLERIPVQLSKSNFCAFMEAGLRGIGAVPYNKNLLDIEFLSMGQVVNFDILLSKQEEHKSVDEGTVKLARYHGGKAA